MWHESRLSTGLHPSYRRLIAPARRSRILARFLFGIHQTPRRDVFVWDWVTLALRKALLGLSLEEAAFLDVGCGYAGVLSIFAHRQGCRAVTAIDVNPDCVNSAQDFLEANGVSATVKLSDMASGLGGGRFDVIAFNSPYIPHAWGRDQRLDREVPRDAQASTVGWSGGGDGTQEIDRFLGEMPAHLAPGGVLLLGFNRFYLEESRVFDLVESGGLCVTETLHRRPFKATVLVIRAREEGPHV